MEKELVSPPTGAVIWLILSGIILLLLLGLIIYRVVFKKRKSINNEKHLFIMLPISILLLGGCTEDREEATPGTIESVIKEFNLERASLKELGETSYLVFENEKEAKSFLNFVKDDYRKVKKSI